MYPRRRRAARAPERAAVRAVLAALVLAAAPAQAQTVRGLMLERDTDRPIDLGEAVLLTLDGDTVAAALTDEQGVFSLTAPEPGLYQVMGIALGYLGRSAGPYELEEDDFRIVQLEMTPAPVDIEGFEVRTTPIVISDDYLMANGFYERLMEGRGQFLTPEDIAASGAKYTPGLFYGLKYVQPNWRQAPWDRWVEVWSPLGSGRCRPRVFVDDVWINKPGYEQYTPGMPLEDIVSRDDIRAAELYWGLQAPNRYGAPAAGDAGLCGAVVIWTNRGS